MRKLGVIVVDDDFAVAQVNRRFVEAHRGFQVLAEAHTGESALAVIERLKPDVILLDIYMPDLGGIEVLRRLRATGNDVEVIAVTAARDLDTIRQARQLGVRHYLVKPFTGMSLNERLEEVWRGAQTLSSADGAELDQSAVDRMLGSPASGGIRLPHPPKGLSAASLSRVTTAISQSPSDVSASEIAEMLGMSRVSARRYLEHLVDTGDLAMAPRYGSAGRPENRYRLRNT